MCCKKIRFLGLNISADGIEATDDHIKTVQNFKTPNSTSQLRRFLGLTSWMRKFIPNYSYIAHSLYQLLKKNVKWVWTDEQQKAFDSLKAALVSPPIFSYPCWEESYNSCTDASSFSYGAISMQIINGNERVIAYAERALLDAEKKVGSATLN